MKKLFCENCGTRIDDGTLFCSVCGSRIENDDEDIIESFAEVSSYADISTPEEETSISENRINLPVNEPVVNTAYKKASYKFEKVLLAVSAICAVCSLAFYLIVANFNGIPMVNKSGNHPTDVPVLTVDMAEEILNNATDFPYQYFEERNMINKNDYIIHPDFIEYASDGDYRCYAVDGIETKDDFFSYFEKYGTREFIEKSLDQSYFYVEKNSKIYFSDNFGMGWYPYSAASMFVEKIDDETYYVKSEEGIVEGVIFKYIDGTFKATTISAKEAYASYNERGASIDLTDIQLGFESTLDSVEKELKKVGLKLDRDNIVYVKAYWGTDGAESYVTGFQKKYKKYKPGEYVGVIVAVEDPEYYLRGAKNGEEISGLMPDEAVKILDIAAFLPMSLHFSEIGILNEHDYINGEYGKYCAADGMETEADVKNYYRQYVTESYYESMTSWYIVQNGKPYFLLYDVGDGGFAEDYTVIKIIDQYAYEVYDTRLMREFIMIYIDGSYKVTDMTIKK